MTAIIDDPNHEHYGPIRRLWVILSGLFSDVKDCTRDYKREWGFDLYDHASDCLSLGMGETEMMREIVLNALHADSRQ